MGINYNPGIVTDNLVTYIDFANSKSSPKTGTSPITITDISRNNVNWTTQNGCTINADNIVLDGTAGYIYSGTGGGYAQAWSPSAGAYGQQYMSFELVFSSSDTGGNIISRPWNGSGQYNYTMSATGFSLHVGSTAASLSYGNICTGTNKHVVWWMNSTQFGMYLNGVQYVAPTNHGLSGSGGSAGTNDFGTLIGSLYPYGQGWAGNTGFSIAGNVYLCRIYKKQLSSAEVWQNFTATRGRFGL